MKVEAAILAVTLAVASIGAGDARAAQQDSARNLDDRLAALVNALDDAATAPPPPEAIASALDASAATIDAFVEDGEAALQEAAERRRIFNERCRTTANPRDCDFAHRWTRRLERLSDQLDEIARGARDVMDRARSACLEPGSADGRASEAWRWRCRDALVRVRSVRSMIADAGLDASGPRQ